MRLLFVTIPASGHINMTLSIAEELSRLGHKIIYASGKSMQEKVHKTGFEFVAVGPPDISQDRIADVLPEIRNLDSREMRRVFFHNWFLPLVAPMARDILSALDEIQPDLMLVDSTAYCGQIVHELTHIPWATFSAGVLWLPSKDLSPFGLGLRPPKTSSEKAAVRRLQPLARQHLRAWDDELNAVRKQFQLKPTDSPSTSLSPQLILYFVSQSFEYPRSDLPSQVHLVGPSIWNQTETFEIESLLISKPLLYATLGTVFHFKTELFDKIMACVAKLNLQTVMSTGFDAPEPFAPPKNVTLLPYVPHTQIFPHVSLVICHGGFNTTIEALAHGVPLLCLPISADQFEVAQRVVEAGAGLRIDVDKINAINLRGAIEKLLCYPHFKTNALKLKADFADYKGPHRAAQLLLQLTSTRCVVHRPV